MISWIQQILAVVVDHMPGFISAAALEWTLYVLITVAVAIIARRFWRQFRARRSLHVEQFESHGLNDHHLAELFRSRLLRTLREVPEAHSGDNLDSAGEQSHLSQPQLSHESGMETLLNVCLETDAAFDVLNKIPELIWPHLRLSGVIHCDEDGTLYCHATLHHGDEVCGMYSLAAPAATREQIVAAAEEIAYRTLFTVTSNENINHGAVITTDKWRAFRGHTKVLMAMSNCNHGRISSDLKRHVEREIEDCIDEDETYALPWYNRGVLYYRTVDGEQLDNAIAAFDHAAELAEAQRASSELARRESLERVLVQALCGAAKCHSQQAHRFADLDMGPVEKARLAAHRAHDLAPSNPHVMFALAFSYNCTDAFVDFEEAIPLYEKIVESHPDRYPEAHNNLSYCHMKFGLHLEAAGDYELAKTHFSRGLVCGRKAAALAARQSTIWCYAGANVGAIQRIQGEHDEALKTYGQMLGAVPSQSTYVEGLNEFSWVWISRWWKSGNETDLRNGLKFHGLALERATTQDHLWKQIVRIMEFFAESNVPWHGDAESLEERVARLEPGARESAWLQGLESLLTNHTPRFSTSSGL